MTTQTATIIHFATKKEINPELVCCWCHRELKTKNALVMHRTYCRYNARAFGHI